MAVSDFLWFLTTWPLFLTDAIISNRGSLFEGLLAKLELLREVFLSQLIAMDRFVLSTKNVRTVLLLSTLFLFIAACFPVALYYKMERDGHVIYCGATLKDALLDYNLLFAFFRWFHCFESCYFHSPFTYHAA